MLRLAIAHAHETRSAVGALRDILATIEE